MEILRKHGSNRVKAAAHRKKVKDKAVAVAVGVAVVAAAVAVAEVAGAPSAEGPILFHRLYRQKPSYSQFKK